MIKYLDLKAINQPYEHAADEVLTSGWYLKGDFTRRFQQAYAEYIGTRHCIGCGNGLDALTLIFRAYIELGVMQEGDEVIVPANTYIASILAVTENRLKPVLVEPSPDTLQIDDALIEQAITERTKAIMIVHLYGRCAYTPHIAALCRRYNLKLIEDNAQAHGCLPAAPYLSDAVLPHRDPLLDSTHPHAYLSDAVLPHRDPLLAGTPHPHACPSDAVLPHRDPLLDGTPHPHAYLSDAVLPHRKTGGLGSAAGHSFYPTKNLGAFGDAGAVTTDDDELAKTIEALGNYGSARHYVFDHQGLNSRMDEIHAAILLAKLPHLSAVNQRRKEIAARYEREISNPYVRTAHSDRDSVHHIFPVFSPRRDELQQYLSDNGIETQIHYPIPPHKQLCYKEWNTLQLPITEQIAREELSLPCYQTLTDDDVSTVINVLNHFS